MNNRTAAFEAAHGGNTDEDRGRRKPRKIVTSYVHPPIPDRRFDWYAYYDGEEERQENGYGATEAEAIADLKANHPDDFPEVLPTGTSGQGGNVAPPQPQTAEAGATFDLVAHLHRQISWSQQAFGPDERDAGIIDHIRKELAEIEDAPGDLSEWIDVVILAFDGAWRRGFSPKEIVAALVAKQAKNEARKWPDWKTAAPGKAIEHDRTAEVGATADPVPAMPFKRNEVFIFLDGSLTIKMDGHGNQDGWGQFSWDEKQIEFVPHEENSGHSIVVDIPKSELIELRDFLNRLYGSAMPDITEAADTIASLRATQRVLEWRIACQRNELKRLNDARRKKI